VDATTVLLARALPPSPVLKPLALPVAGLPTAEYAERLLGKLDDE
jgi:hypothetical protein